MASFVWQQGSFSAIFLQVNADGAISFGGPLSNGGPTDLAPPRGIGLVAPFWGDVDTGSTGNVFYRSSQDPVLLEQVAGIVTTSFQHISDPPLNSLFIVTWDQVPAQGRLVSEVWKTCIIPISKIL